MALPPLPIDDHIDTVREALARSRVVVLSAPPGAGKTTRIPPALADAGPLILLQPRRLAARAVARRIADEQGWSIGRDIGWQIRFERRFGRDTRVLVVTEGILTARLQQDPLLSEFTTVVFDEFHERSIHADLGLALARQSWRARDDLRIVVMSATLDIEPIVAFLEGAPAVHVPGALHPLAIEYGDGESLPQAVASVMPRTSGQILCFLPGAREIDVAARELSSIAASAGVEVVPLHGSLDGDAQDSAIAAVDSRRIILATNIAETSLTVPGVTAVIDTGQVKVARYDAERGIDRLSLERVTLDSAEQRAGRAARLGPGLVRRLWDARLRLRARREPDIARVDLAGPLLDLLAWGADPNTFEWFEAPSADRVSPALSLLQRLEAVDAQFRITALGRQMQRIPLHPRLARILLDGRGAPEIAAACASLGEGVGRGFAGRSRMRETPPDPFQAVARDLQRLASTVLGEHVARHATDSEIRHAMFTGYADRLAKRRPGDRARFVLASGHGAILARDIDVGDAEFIVALEVTAGEHAPRPGPGQAPRLRSGQAPRLRSGQAPRLRSGQAGVSEATIREASPVDAAWIHPTASAVEHRFDAESGRVRAARVDRYDEIVLNETPVAVDVDLGGRLLGDAWLARVPDESTTQLLRRLRFAAIEFELSDLVYRAAASSRRVDEIDLEAHLPFDVKRMLASAAPPTLVVPSGRTMKLEYGEDGSVSASVKLQELFGLAASPTIGPARVPVTFHLLAPNGRPVQTTRDLRSFWERTYPEVRKELRGRYPRHPWPEDPWSAPPTHRTQKRGRA